MLRWRCWITPTADNQPIGMTANANQIKREPSETTGWGAFPPRLNRSLLASTPTVPAGMTTRIVLDTIIHLRHAGGNEKTWKQPWISSEDQRTTSSLCNAMWSHSPPTGICSTSPLIAVCCLLLGIAFTISLKTSVAGGIGVPRFSTPKAPTSTGWPSTVGASSRAISTFTPRWSSSAPILFHSSSVACTRAGLIPTRSVSRRRTRLGSVSASWTSPVARVSGSTIPTAPAGGNPGIISSSVNGCGSETSSPVLPTRLRLRTCGKFCNVVWATPSSGARLTSQRTSRTIRRSAHLDDWCQRTGNLTHRSPTRTSTQHRATHAGKASHSMAAAMPSLVDRLLQEFGERRPIPGNWQRQ